MKFSRSFLKFERWLDNAGDIIAVYGLFRYISMAGIRAANKLQ